MGRGLEIANGPIHPHFPLGSALVPPWFRLLPLNANSRKTQYIVIFTLGSALVPPWFRRALLPKMNNRPHTSSLSARLCYTIICPLDHEEFATRNHLTYRTGWARAVSNAVQTTASTLPDACFTDSLPKTALDVRGPREF